MPGFNLNNLTELRRCERFNRGVALALVTDWYFILDIGMQVCQVHRITRYPLPYWGFHDLWVTFILHNVSILRFLRYITLRPVDKHLKRWDNCDGQVFWVTCKTILIFIFLKCREASCIHSKSMNDNSVWSVYCCSESDLPFGNVFTLTCCVYILLCL